jgi:hypothetical protein
MVRVGMEAVGDKIMTSTMDTSISNRDWREDFSHENGNYQCRCVTCEQSFIGHKRRVLCKLCHNKKQRVVCAAVRFADGLIVTGARHFDDIMHRVIDRVGLATSKDCADAEQGFIDQWGNFIGRHEAFVIASNQEQLLAEPNVNGTLFSEDLY